VRDGFECQRRLTRRDGRRQTVPPCGQVSVRIEVEQQERELHRGLSVHHRVVDLHQQPDRAVVERGAK